MHASAACLRASTDHRLEFFLSYRLPLTMKRADGSPLGTYPQDVRIGSCAHFRWISSWPRPDRCTVEAMNGWGDAFGAAGLSVMSKAELVSCGATDGALTAAVRSGHLLRLRRDRYSLPSLDSDAQRAVRVGGRLTCVSALASYGVFAFDTRNTHIHLVNHMSRLRSPQNRGIALDVRNRSSVELHWGALLDPHGGNDVRVGIVDALAQAVRCTHPWHAIASVDNALHLGLVDQSDVAEIFRWAPDRFGWLRTMVDGRAEAGQESVLRMIVHEAGFNCELQQVIDGVGRVDLVVEDCVALEADSRAHHNGWEAHVRDRGRDLELAVRGYASLRPAYAHTMHNPLLVKNAVSGLVHQQVSFASS